jgi:hypothetical protein
MGEAEEDWVRVDRWNAAVYRRSAEASVNRPVSSIVRAAPSHPSPPRSARCPGLALVVLFAVALSTGQALAQVPDWVTGDTGLFEPNGAGGWRKANWKDHADALKRLLEHCCEQFRTPFDLPPGTTIVPGEDDKDLTRERTRAPKARAWVHGPNGEEPVPGATTSHCGLDVGSRVTADGGATIATLGSATVSPIHTGGYMRVKDGELQQRIMCEHEGLRLVVEFSYGHVKPRPGLGPDWVETPGRGHIGTLDGDDAWVSNDPRFKVKGNHIHLELDGIYDKSWSSEMAHNQQVDGQPIDPELADLLRRRAAFLNDCLLQKLTGGR